MNDLAGSESRAGMGRWHRRGPVRRATLVDLLRRRAHERPESLAYAFLDDGGKEGERLSYGDLDREARRIGAWLQKSGTPGDRALLLFPAGLDFLKAFFGCLYAGAIAHPGAAAGGQPAQADLAAAPGDRRGCRGLGGDLQSGHPARWWPGRETMSRVSSRWRHLDIGADPPRYSDPWREPGSSPTTWPISSTPRARRRAPRAS